MFENSDKGMLLLREVQPSLRLYSYMHLDKFKVICDDRRLTLRRPEGWTDPHEKWWCDQLFRAGGPLRAANAYAFCWTTRTTDEPFWRLYSCWCGPGHPDPQPAVRVSTTVGKLMDVMQQAVAPAPAKVFIGRVHYRSGKALGRVASTLRAGKGVASEVASGLHLKRTAFRFESEVRALWVDNLVRREETYVSIDPAKFIDQVMVGPTNHLHLLEAVKCEVARRKFDPEESSIYKTPK